MSLNSLKPLIEKTGSRLSPEQFQNAVNVAFHDVESEHYDEIHANMWQSLQQQLDLLASELPALGDGLHLLDIGCGTGLSSELLLNTVIGEKISKVTLVDTSPEMLAKASDRAKGWSREITAINSEVGGVIGKFDVILVCSVLHHIPDLHSFLNKIDSLQQKGGIFIHLQDPNGDHLGDPGLAARELEYRKATEHQSLSKKVKGLIPKTLKRKLSKLLNGGDYLDKVNDILIGQKVIARPMSPEEIWSVTDIHVDNLPFSVGEGISYNLMKSRLSSYEPVTFRSYGFFGFLKSELSSDFQGLEQKLIEQREVSGRHFGAAWVKAK